MHACEGVTSPARVLRDVLPSLIAIYADEDVSLGHEHPGIHEAAVFRDLSLDHGRGLRRPIPKQHPGALTRIERDDFVQTLVVNIGPRCDVRARKDVTLPAQDVRELVLPAVGPWNDDALITANLLPQQ